MLQHLASASKSEGSLPFLNAVGGVTCKFGGGFCAAEGPQALDLPGLVSQKCVYLAESGVCPLCPALGSIFV